MYETCARAPRDCSGLRRLVIRLDYYVDCCLVRLDFATDRTVRISPERCIAGHLSIDGDLRPSCQNNGQCSQ